MSSNHCYLCASDEGILLDIFGVGGKAICKKIETCLSVKIEESNALSTKICHKCAYELDACSKFVQKYREARDGNEAKINPIKGHCSLCSEPGKEGYIFHCKDGNPVNGSLQKIHEIFNDSIFKDKRRNLSICLDCRYNLDVLFDLKCIYQSTPDKLQSLNEKGLKLSQLPKTTTRVVKRKTTYIPLPRLNGVEVSDTDSSSTASTMPLTRKRGRPRKDSTSTTIFRTCEECEINVESGIDMYRYHSTGHTVCKDCWLSMDPEKVTHNKRKKLGLASGDVGTRRCAIVLKDVLTNPAKYENIYKVEKDEHGNTTFIVTDDSSENEEREKMPAKRSRRSHGSVTSVETTPVKTTRASKRAASIKSTDLDDEPPAKITSKKVDEDKASTSRSTRTRNGLATSDTEVFMSRTRRKSIGKSVDSEKTLKAASDLELAKPLVQKRVLRTKSEKIEPADSSSNEMKIPSTTRARKTAKIVTSVVSTSDQVERTIRRTRANSLSSQEALSLSNRLNTVTPSSKSLSEAGSPPSKTRRSKTKSLSPKDSGSELEMEKPYTCNVCRVEYKSKLIGMEHELTHAKQPEVKLQRVAIPEIIVEEAPAESSLIEEPEEQSHDVSSTSDRQPEDPENIETSTAAPNEQPSIDLAVETNENTENLTESKNLPEANEVSAKVDDKKDGGEDKTESTINEEEKTKDKINEEEDKSENKRNEEDKIEDKTIEKVEKIDDKADEKVDEIEDKIDDKENEESDKIEDKIDEGKGRTDHKSGEEEDKTDVKLDNEVETENKINSLEATEPETAVEDNESCEKPVEKVKEDETKDTTTITECDKDHDSKETEAITKDAADERPESTLNNEVEKQIETAETIEKPSEEVLQESTEKSENINGIIVENADSAVNETNEMEKEAVALDSDTESKITDFCNPPKSIEMENVTSVTSTAPEKEKNDDKDTEDNVSLHEDQTTKDLEGEAEAATTEPAIVNEKNTTKGSEESESIVNDVLTEVFNLATAEVQKRLENETPRDEKCTTPVSETLENISREICNSADMPSLEPLIEDQTSNNQP